MSVTAISFYWRNATPSFVTWRSRLVTAPDTPTCIVLVIHGGQFTGGVHPPNQFVPDIVSPLPCSPALVRHTLLIVYFFKKFISFIGSLDKCHTSVFNALITTGGGVLLLKAVLTCSLIFDLNHRLVRSIVWVYSATPGWLSGEHVGLMIWWL